MAGYQGRPGMFFFTSLPEPGEGDNSNINNNRNDTYIFFLEVFIKETIGRVDVYLYFFLSRQALMQGKMRNWVSIKEKRVDNYIQI